MIMSSYLYPAYDADPSLRRQASAGDRTDQSVIRTAAEMFIDRYGDRAATEARLRSEELLQAQNYQGRARWQLIEEEILALQSQANTAH